MKYLIFCLFFCISCVRAEVLIEYKVEFLVEKAQAKVDIIINNSQQELKEIIFNLEQENKFISFEGHNLTYDNSDKLLWKPKDAINQLSYLVNINQFFDKNSFKSFISNEFAILNMNLLVPKIKSSYRKNAKSLATISFTIDEKWTMQSSLQHLTTIDKDNSKEIKFLLANDYRFLVRPQGFVILGSFTSLQDKIQNIEVVVASVKHQKTRKADLLAILTPILTYLQKTFPQDINKLLFIQATHTLFDENLFSNNSFYIHNNQQFISLNINDKSFLKNVFLNHIKLSFKEKDEWILNALANYFVLDLLRKTNFISQMRYEKQIERLKNYNKNILNTKFALRLMLEISQKVNLNNIIKDLQKLNKEIDFNDFRSVLSKYTNTNILNNAVINNYYQVKQI